MGTESVVKLVWKMGLPMIVSMILQSVYNIVDTSFVINMGEDGVAGNLALTYAFPVQLMIISIGVGTGVGINALLSKQLGEKNADGAKRTVGNGIFSGLVIYAVFLIFGLFGCRAFIAVQSVLQALGYAVSPFIISFLRLCALVMPVDYLFTLSGNSANVVWWAFPIAEVATAVFSTVVLKLACRKKISVL